MADITITIPNAHIGRTVDALCAVGGYTGDPDDQPGRRAFAQSVVATFVRQTVMQAERHQAMAEAMATITVAPVTIE